MGCDIHVLTELRNDYHNKWVNCDDWRYNFDYDDYENTDVDVMKFRLKSTYTDRNYGLFALLSNVRNYYDVPSFEFDRGVPDDIHYLTRYYIDYWNGDGHTHSWCTYRELMNAYNTLVGQHKEWMRPFVEAISDRFHDVCWSDDDNFDKFRIIFFYDN